MALDLYAIFYLFFNIGPYNLLSPASLTTHSIIEITEISGNISRVLLVFIKNITMGCAIN